MSGFRCPKCNCLYSSVKSTRNMTATPGGRRKSSVLRGKEYVIRYRQCQNQSCMWTFTTYEMSEDQLPPEDKPVTNKPTDLDLPPNPYI